MSELLSQQEIDALIKMGQETEQKDTLRADEMDVLGEIGNIGMGTAATTLSVLLNKKVVITTPKVSVMKPEDMSVECPYPCVAVEINYTDGLEGTNLLILQRHDVKVITDLLMGGTGDVEEETEITDIHLSAIGEVMNQMMGSSSTSLASVFGHAINISPPNAMLINFAEDKPLNAYPDNKYIINISFKMEIEGLIDSQIMQIMSLKFGRELVEHLYNKTREIVNTSNETVGVDMTDEKPSDNAQQEIKEHEGTANKAKIDVTPVQFQSFDENEVPNAPGVENLDLIMDIPLQVTVVLGSTKKEVKEILTLGPGAVIELDKLAGEPVDILVNGKQIAWGEVVVIDENFGVRINDIISPSKRIQKMGK